MSSVVEKREVVMSRVRMLWVAGVFVALAGLMAVEGAYVYGVAKDFSWLRNECLLAMMAVGIGGSVCLAGVIYVADMPLVAREAEGFDTSRGPAWYVRLLLGAVKWVVMVLQLAAMGLAVAAAGIFIFGFRIPGV